jgi:hypothetical protein
MHRSALDPLCLTDGGNSTTTPEPSEPVEYALSIHSMRAFGTVLAHAAHAAALAFSNTEDWLPLRNLIQIRTERRVSGLSLA